jgi:hypothetical protein
MLSRAMVIVMGAGDDRLFSNFRGELVARLLKARPV